ncbi:MAG: type II secretion system protein GspM [Xanthobacteraceae bacterium]|jgi:general secretion pathway protein M
MSTDQTLVRHLTRYPAVAVACYVALVAICAFAAWAALADVYGRHRALAAATDMLDQIEGRKQSPGRADALGANAPAGFPFLEGQSVTIAGAALQQRVTGAVTKTGGNVLSTQIDLNSPQAKDGFVSLIVSCEVAQPALQQVLYDLEAGMPFLFVDQLEVQAPQASGREAGPMRVLMTVSGQWQGKQ